MINDNSVVGKLFGRFCQTSQARSSHKWVAEMKVAIKKPDAEKL